MTEHPHALGSTRRQFLGGLAVAGAVSLVAGGPELARSATPKHKGVIDLHHHFWSPEYLKAQDDWENAHHLPHFAAMQTWTPEVSLAEMDKAGVQTAVVELASISQGFWGLEPQAADRVVRATIDYAVKMMSDHKGRFGLFAPLSMNDTDLSLKQIEYAFDQAHADGIGLQTSYNGQYPGDASFAPIWEELNRRKAVVSLHGANPACCSAVKDGPGMFASVVEVTFDATRAVASLLTSGALVRYPNIKWVVAYDGGAIPYLAGRIDAFVKGKMMGPEIKPNEIAPHGVFAALRNIYYDTVNVTAAPSWKALTDLVRPSQIVYGTDFIYFNDDQLDAIDKRGLSPKDKEAILSGNAKRLFPRLAKA